MMMLRAATLFAALPMLVCAAPEPSTAPQKTYDLWIRGGTVIDGTGHPGVGADVLVSGDTVAYVGTVDASQVHARRTINATGKIVTPGFIDAHSHGDPLSQSFLNFLAQGITTVVLGQDGATPGFDPDKAPESVAKWLQRLDEHGSEVNVATLSGHGTLRLLAGVGDKPEPTPQQLARMEEILTRDLADGAFGMSFGLEYAPGRYAQLAEEEALGDLVGREGGIVMSHMRTEDTGKIGGAIDELLQIHAHVHISHIKIVAGHRREEADAVLAQLAQARARGRDITVDVYPYTASASDFVFLYPNWAKEKADYDEAVRHRRPELEAHIRKRIAERNGPDAILFTDGPYAGQTLGQVAKRLGKPYEKVMIDDLGYGGPSQAHFLMSPEVQDRFIEADDICISTDGAPGAPHPRAAGSFAKILEDYVGPPPKMSLEKAIFKMSGLTARIVGIPGRGVIASGNKADILILSPGKVHNRATWTEPTLAPTGFDTIVVNGAIAYENSRPDSRTHGRALRRAQIQYPAAARGDQIDEYHGTSVADPYRGLEDIDAPATRQWVEAEARLSNQYLAAIPGRADIARQLREIWNFERWSNTERYGKNWFYLHNDGLQNQPVVFVASSPENRGRVLLDPNALSNDGSISLQSMAVSSDGRLMAYALSDGGSDWRTWHVRDVATGKDLPDEIHWSKAGGGAWKHDGSGFYYTAFDAPSEGAQLKAVNHNHKLYFHRLGTQQASDTLVYTRDDSPDWWVNGQVTDDGRYLVIEASPGSGVENIVLTQDLTTPNAAIVPVVAQPTADYELIGNLGATLYLLTDDHAPRYRVIAVDLKRPDAAHWRTIVAESGDTLSSATLVGGQLLTSYMKDAHSVARRFSPRGERLGEVTLPGLGVVEGFPGHWKDKTSYYDFSSYATPPSVLKLDLASGKSSLVRRSKLSGFEPDDYETRQVFYSSRDGTRVPMFIVARKGVKLEGDSPTLLYGYGGFSIPVLPAFSPAVAGWLRTGGVYAAANLRGGGEYGREWHEAGMKARKQNVFDDFIAAAEYLIANRWTRPQRLAIIGRSNGGLLVGATEEQRPQLFAAAVPQVGVMDMLRFQEFTVGKGWESDYGSVDGAEEFKALLAYSPYHNVKAGVAYPATLVTTGDHDDRVHPAHSFKFVAQMQHANPQGAPVLLRVDTRAGHGYGKPTTQLIEETADIYAFVRNAMGLTSGP